MSNMTAIHIKAPGGAEMLEARPTPRPTPGPGEVLIKVAAAGINRPDILQRQGKYPVPAGVTPIPGLEVAGHIAALGSQVLHWREGDPVMALLAGGGYAEYALAPVGQCLPPPPGMSLAEAATIPEAYATIWANLIELARFSPGESVLIHGGASGIGTAGLQLVTALSGRAIVTVGSVAKQQRCLELGANAAILYHEKDFAEEVRHLSGGRGVDIVLDMVGGDYVARNLSCLAPMGRHISIATQLGSKAEINIFELMRRRLTLSGSLLRPRSVAEKTTIMQAVYELCWPLFAARQLVPVLDKSFPLEKAADAHRYMESGAHIGKIALLV